jgi:hypothetical protein
MDDEGQGWYGQDYNNTSTLKKVELKMHQKYNIVI